MTADAFVLVHGGFHDSRCWERLIPLLRSPALAVDLPGRGTRPAKLADVTLEACVRSVVAWCLARVGPDSRKLFTDRASRAGLPDSLPRTYIRLRRDRSVSWAQQAHAISLLPGLAVREIDAPHQAMVTHPVEVAAILNELAGA